MAAALLGGCQRSELAGPAPLDEDCTGAPVPGQVSLWTECLRPSVGRDLGCGVSTVPILLTNDSADDVYVLHGCGFVEESSFFRAADGSWSLDTVCPIPGCPAERADWLLLPPGGTYEQDVSMGTHGDHVVRVLVGFGCRPEDPVVGPHWGLCESRRELATPVFEVVP